MYIYIVYIYSVYIYIYYIYIVFVYIYILYICIDNDIYISSLLYSTVLSNSLWERINVGCLDKI